MKNYSDEDIETLKYLQKHKGNCLGIYCRDCPLRSENSTVCGMLSRRDIEMKVKITLKQIKLENLKEILK